MKNFASLLVFLTSYLITAQNNSNSFEKYPVFTECAQVTIDELENCFYNTLQTFVFSNFKTPEIVQTENYTGEVVVFFEVNKEGNFKVLYVDAIYNDLEAEARRVFEALPKITPATYNGNPAYLQFTMPIKIPLRAPTDAQVPQNSVGSLSASNSVNVDSLKQEFDAVKEFPYTNEEYISNINIPLSHHNYGLFDAALNRVGQNNHTAQKPYIYSEVNTYYDFEAENQKILKNKTSWWGRKWWNEHMVTFKGEDYWFTLDPGVDLQVGKDFDGDVDTYNNTRLIYTQGGLGKTFSFFAAVFESQGRFAKYYNDYAESIKPDGGNPAIIPSRGIAKRYKTDSYDYPIAVGHISYTPSKWFNFQLGHGKNFIGDGYRSLLLSDNASPYPSFKINATFWKMKYTALWMSLKDVRPEVTTDGSFRPKYMASHYLSYNVTKRLNLGFFESVIWENDNGQGFDWTYLNPVIFFRAVEFSSGSRGGNALIGLSGKYKFTDRINAYAQLVIDEFSTSDIFSGNGSYKNKIGYQIGGKYYDAFGVKDLLLQAEYNRVRPYTYSHNSITLNYGHNNQSMAHTLDANFSEFIAIARYQKGRMFGDAKVVMAKRGFDYNTAEDSFAYGGNIYSSEDDRPADLGNDIHQGNTTTSFHTEIQLGYLINPATNLKVYGSFIYRDFKPAVNTDLVFENQTSWINFGIRTDLFNWYYDF